jgi:hypothetical protein
LSKACAGIAVGNNSMPVTRHVAVQSSQCRTKQQIPAAQTESQPNRSASQQVNREAYLGKQQAGLPSIPYLLTLVYYENVVIKVRQGSQWLAWFMDMGLAMVGNQILSHEIS